MNDSELASIINAHDTQKFVSQVTLKAIQTAAQELKSVVYRTPTVKSPWLSNLIQGDVYLKLENLQHTGSFKPRGAYIAMSRLGSDVQKRGVITMSAGNHAQGVAYHAKQMGIPATIVMPENTPMLKVERTRVLGASTVLHGKSVLEARDFAIQLMKRDNSYLIHPFDDVNIILGQGSVGLELLEDIPHLDALVIPIGGGGLACGMGVVAKALNPDIQLIGVQSFFCPTTAEILFPNSLAGHTRKEAQTVAEGIAIKFPGKINLSILHSLLDDMLIVNELMIEQAMESLIANNKVVAEGAGAAGVAAIMNNRSMFQGKRVGTVICGGNVDSRLLANLLMRGLVHEGRLVRFNIEISDTPGILGHLTQIIGRAGGNIFEISHQRLFNNVTAKMAYVDAVVETRDAEHAQTICKALIEGHFPTTICED